jgi:hypothetical protein
LTCRQAEPSASTGDFVQIDTYGRAEREVPGKVSQSLQFDEKSARALFDILRDTFAFR